VATKSKSNSSSGNGRSASQKTEKYRFAKNVDGRATVAEREYRDYAKSPLAETGQDPDVLLDVPVVKVDKIYLKLSDLEAHVAVKAQVLDLVEVDVGVDAYLGKLEIDIEGVEAQALLKVRLDHLVGIVDRVFTTIDRNPELVESLGQAIEDVGAGTGDLVGESGEAVEEIGEGAEEAVPQIGRGAGEAVDQVGQGAGQAVGDVGEGAGQAVGDVGEGAGQAVGDLGEDAGELIAAPTDAKDAAKKMAMSAAHEISTAVSEEAKELGQAATRKVKKLGDRRRQHRAERHPATEAAQSMADQLGIDIGAIEGTGKNGRVKVEDVKRAVNGQ
jgi:hypothetical protein